MKNSLFLLLLLSLTGCSLGDQQVETVPTDQEHEEAASPPTEKSYGYSYEEEEEGYYDDPYPPEESDDFYAEDLDPEYMELEELEIERGVEYEGNFEIHEDSDLEYDDVY